MFERFTERARQVVVFAQDEARSFDHDYIATEHILLGLLREPEGLAGRVLEDLGVTLASVRGEVTRLVGRGAAPPGCGLIPFSPRAKKVLELSLRESLSLGYDYIGTEHILLGLVRQEEGAAAAILTGHDVGADRVRSILAAKLGADARAFATSPARWRRRRPRRLASFGVDVGQPCWEYRIEQRGSIETPWLDELGAEGWELVTVHPQAGGFELIFKRRRFPGALRAAG